MTLSLEEMKRPVVVLNDKVKIYRYEKVNMDNSKFVALASQVAAAFVTRNLIQASEVPELTRQIYATLVSLSSGADVQPIGDRRPAVPIKKSLSDDWIICLEDGQKFKSLKRHLMTAYDLTPEQYRERWGLPSDYPMVAPNYSIKRSALAKQMGLGQAARGKPPRGRKSKP